MVLIFTNSKERAMVLAVAIDGVVLRDKRKVRLSNFAEMRDALSKELDINGSLKVFFRGEPHVIIYSNGMPCALNRMVDYDPSYATIANRPIPFFPDSAQYRYVDHEFEEHVSYYSDLVNGAAYIINAASDDYRGEISFFQFLAVTGYTGEHFRVRPMFISSPSVIEAFNSFENIGSRRRVEAACAMREKFDWLFTCNATNALTSWNYERKPLVASRAELVLLELAMRAQHGDAKSDHLGCCVRLTMRNDIGTVVHATSIQRMTKEDAVAFCRKAEVGEQIAVAQEGAVIQEPNRMMNAFQVQAEALKRYGISPEQTCDILEHLYLQGYISWPTDSRALPWSYKNLFSQIVAASLVSESGASVVLPRDVDDFNDWDLSEPPFGHGGIIATGNPAWEEPLSDAKNKVYRIIVDSNTNTLSQQSSSGASLISFTYAGLQFEVEETPCYAMTMVIDACETARAESVSESLSRVDELLGQASRIYQSASINDMHVFHAALSNMKTWGLIDIAGDWTYAITERGKLLWRYCGTIPSLSVDSLTQWDIRLHKIMCAAERVTSFRSDYRDYIGKMVNDIRAQCDEITSMKGHSRSEMVCPECGAPMSFSDDVVAARCTNSTCKFKIAKELYGHTVTMQDVVELITDGRTSRINDFNSNGKQYSARLVRNNRTISRSYESDYTCPFCGSPLSEYTWEFRCKDSACGFKLPYSLAEHSFTQEEISALLSMATVGPVRFVSKKTGKPYNAKINIDESTKAIKFIFPEKS